MSSKKEAELKEVNSASAKKPAKTAAAAKGKKAPAKKTAAAKGAATKKTAAVKKTAAEDTEKTAAKAVKTAKPAAKPARTAKAAKPAAAKKAPARKTAAKPAAGPAGSHQSEAQVAAVVDKNKIEALDGAAVYRGIHEIKDAPYEMEAIAALASRRELAQKSVAENNVQKNLSARSAADAKIAAKGYKKPKKAKAKKVNAAGQTKAQAAAAISKIASEAADGARVYRGIAEIPGTPYEETVKAAQKRAALASRKELALKSVAENNVQKNLSAHSAKAKLAYLNTSSHQSQAERKEVTDMISNEAGKGVHVYQGIEKLSGESQKVAPEMASRIELARKSAAENNVQKNLSARSAADAKIAAKGYKKPKKAKALNAAGQTKAQAAAAISKIASEANKGAKVYKGIEEVPGTPYEEVVKAAQKTAAMAARKALASKQKPAKGSQSEKGAMTEKQKFYDSLDDQTLMEMVQAVGLDMDLETLKNELSAAASIADKIAAYEKEAAESGKSYSFAKDGFDSSVIPYLCNRIAAALPNKAEDHKSLADKFAKDVNRMLINDSLNDTAIYKDLFDDVRQVLMTAQENDLNTLEEVEKIIPADLNALVSRFMDVAYTILPGWQYNDVKYYEGFLYGVLSQFDDLAPIQNRAMMDIADLYILHGDYNKGNADYGYVLRENQLKDQIYYRFANVYRPFDIQRAKGIAQDALRVIDDRYDYYPKILEILMN